MKDQKIIIVAICAVLLFYPILLSAQQNVDQAKILERLARLEEGQKALNQRFDDVNNRFNDINNRFNDMGGRFDEVMTWLQIMSTILGLVFIGIFGTLLLMWRRVVTVEARVNEAFRFDERDRMQVFYEERLKKLEQRVKVVEELTAK